LLLGLAYATQSPLLTRPDEPFHLTYVEYLKQHGTLPIMRQQRMAIHERARWEPEAHQPPLYYGLVALLTLGNTMDDADQLYLPNPHYLSTVAGNTSAYAPSPSRAELVLYVGRLLSLAFGVVVGVFSYAIAREFIAPPLATAALAFTILNPQFLFISSAVSNDVPCVAAATWGLWLVLRMARDGVTARRALAFGLAVGLGALLKLSVFVLLGLLPLLALARLWSHRSWRAWLNAINPTNARYVMVGALPIVVLLAPLFIYNWQTYGDPLTTRVIIFYMGERRNPLTLQQWIDIVALLWKGYWLDFSGGGAGYAASWVYGAPAVVMLVGLVGAVRQAWRRAEWRWLLALLMGWSLLVLVALLSLIARTVLPLGGGRLLYPAIAAWGVLTVVGLARGVPARGMALMSVAMPLVALATLVIYIWPQGYAFHFIQHRTLPAPQGAFALATQARITGYMLEQHRDSADVYVAWEALQPFTENYSVFVQLWDMSNPAQPRVVAQVDTYPWLGYLPTRRWVMGQTIVDRYPMRLPTDLPKGWRGLVVTGLYLSQGGQRLPLADATGQRLPFDAAPVGWLEVR
jgi:4-amino-4-deoxy-L-arabinose transferase-like glycosyltransferase